MTANPSGGVDMLSKKNIQVLSLFPDEKQGLLLFPDGAFCRLLEEEMGLPYFWLFCVLLDLLVQLPGNREYRAPTWRVPFRSRSWSTSSTSPRITPRLASTRCRRSSCVYGLPARVGITYVNYVIYA